MEERWKLVSSDDELKFFFDDKLVIHLFKSDNKWFTNVLGRNEVNSHKDLSHAIKDAERGAIECGWISVEKN